MLVFPGPIFTPPSAGGGSPPSFPASGVVVSDTDGSGWNVDNSSITTGITDPLAGTTAGRMTNGGISSQAAYVRKSATYSNATQYTFSCYMKADGADYGWMNFYDGTTEFGVMFNLSTGAVVGNRTGGGTISSSGVTSYGSGWYRCWFTFTTTNNNSNTYNAQVGVSSNGNLDFLVNSSSSTVKILVWRMQVAAGALDT